MNQSLGVLEKLTEAARKLSNINRLSDIHKGIFDAAEHVFGCHQAAIFLKENDSDLLVVAANRGELRALEVGQRIHLGQDVKGRAIASGTTQLVTKTINGDNSADPAGTNTCEAVIPLIGDDNAVVGIIDIIGDNSRLTGMPLPMYGLFSEIVSAALSKSNLKSALEDRAKRLVSVSKAVQVTTSELPLTTMLRKICELTQEALKPDGCSIQLCSEDRSQLIVEAYCGLGEDISGMRVPKNCGVPGVAMATRRPTLTPNMADSKAPERSPVASDYMSELAVPLAYRNQIMGVLHLGHRQPGIFGENDLLNATILADCAAKCIGASRSLSDAVEDASYNQDSLSLLVSTTTGMAESKSFDEIFSEIFPQVASFLRFKRAAVLTPVSDHTALEAAFVFGYGDGTLAKRLPLERSLPGEAYRTAKTVFTTQGDGDDGAVLDVDALPIQVAVPLKHADEVFGVLLIESSNRLLPQEISTLETVSAQLSTAFRNAQLVDATTAWRKRLDALKLAGEVVVNKTQPAEAILGRIVDAAVEGLGLERCAVLLLNDSKEKLSMSASSGYGNKKRRQVSIDQGLIGAAARQGVPLLIEDTDEDERYEDSGFDAGCEMAAPLSIDGVVVGVLDAEGSEPGCFGKTELNVLSAFANLAATALRDTDTVTASRRRQSETSPERALLELPLRIADEKVGALTLQCRCDENLGDDGRRVLNTLASQAEIALKNARLFENTKKIYYDTLCSLAQALEERDEYTRGHSERVAGIAKQIAEEMTVDEATRQTLYDAALLHDIGRIGICDEVIRAPRKLTSEEKSIVEEHPVFGNTILLPLSFLGQIRESVRHHHERWDGTGYPDRKKGEDIPLASRIIAVADAYDAMTSARPYRESISRSDAIDEIRSLAGQQFDPAVVAAFLKVSTKLPF